MKAHFILALDNLEGMLAENATRVLAATRAAVDAVETGNPVPAQGIIDGDRAVNDAENAIEEECLKLLALYQPVAGDLRRVVTVLKVNGEVERVGDLAVNIAERLSDMAANGGKAAAKVDFQDMAERAGGMFRSALDSLASHDAALAEDVIHADDAVDALHRGNYARVRDGILASPAAAAYYLDCLTVSRALERIADIATNIAEDVVYLESGRIVRHC